MTDALRTRLEAERTIPLERYVEEGCATRVEYLEGLADDMNMSLEEFADLTNVLGPDEDFDALIILVVEHG